MASARVSFTHPGRQTALAITAADQVAGEATIEVLPTLFALRPVTAAGAAPAAGAPAALTSVAVGAPAHFTLVAEDDHGVPVDGFGGDVVIGSDDAGAVIALPPSVAQGVTTAAAPSGGANYQFQPDDHGVATLGVTFASAGSHQLRVRDAASLALLAEFSVPVGAPLGVPVAPSASSLATPAATNPSTGTSDSPPSGASPTPVPVVPPTRPHSEPHSGAASTNSGGAPAARTNLPPSGVEETAARLSSPLPAAGAEEAGAATALGSGPSPLDQAQAQRTSLNRTSLSLTASPTTSAIGAAISVTVTAMQNGSVLTTYAGTIEFTSSDPAFAPGTAYRYTFTGADAGVHTLP